MPRLRTNNVFGTTTDAPLLVGATTLNSAGLANLGVVAAPNVAVITLDPNRVNGAPEIVHVTAHTGSATSATILRGQEGTAARQHAAGTFWVHAATIVDWGTDWAAYAPTFVNFTLGNGTLLGRFARLGNVVHFRWAVTLGSTSSMGTNPTFTLPATSTAIHSVTEQEGRGWARDESVPSDRLLVSTRNSTTVWGVFSLGTNSTLVNITSTAPFTWVSTDQFGMSGTYEAA